MMKMRNKILLLAVTMFLGQNLFTQTCMECGNGSDSVYHATSNTSIVGAEYHFTTFTIDSGVTVNVTGSQPLIIRSTGTIKINGILDASGGNGGNGVTFSTNGIGGIGVAGGQNGGDGVFHPSAGPLNGVVGNGTGAGGQGMGWAGGGGAGYASAGASSGGAGVVGGVSYGATTINPFDGGSGGGGGSGGNNCGSGGGGAGGGYISITGCDSLIIGTSGSVKVNGGNGGSDGTGNCGGGGGGSGGSLLLTSPAIDNNGSLEANGGLGGASQVPGSPYYGTGGNGSEGRIRLDGIVSGTGSISPSAGYLGNFALLNTIASVTPSDSICKGEIISLLGSSTGNIGPVSYLWNPGGLMGNPVVTADSSITYTLFATDSIGCLDSATLNITVFELPSVSLNITTDTLCIYNSAITLNANPSGGNFSGTGVTGNSFDPGTAGVGQHWVYYTYADSNLCENIDSSGITVIGCTGLNDPWEAMIRIYPNPASDNIQISGLVPHFPVSITLTDITGKTVQYVKIEPDENVINFALKEISSGVYYVHIQQQGLNKSTPLIIK